MHKIVGGRWSFWVWSIIEWVDEVKSLELVFLCEWWICDSRTNTFLDIPSRFLVFFVVISLFGNTKMCRTKLELFKGKDDVFVNRCDN